jgi:hypothetical protein
MQRPFVYNDWTTGYALTGNPALPTADANGDGVTNLLEYAFNLAPTSSNVILLPAAQVQTYNVGGQNHRYLSITFPRQLSTGDINYEVQASGDLSTWTPVCTATGTASPTGPGYVSEVGTSYLRSVTARDTVDLDSGAKRFLRIKVTKN